MTEIWIGLLFALFWIGWKWWNKNYTYWIDKGFPNMPSSWPLGSLTELIFFSRYQGLVVKEAYEKYKNNSYVGVVIGRRPQLVLCDPDVIKQIMLKDFNNFTDRINADFVGKSPTSRHLFNLGGDEWKSFRTKMSPTFSSGKLKMMFQLFQKCAGQLEDMVTRRTNQDIDVKEVMSRFTCDVISSCAFGIDTNCLASDDSAVYNMAVQIFPAKVSFHRKFMTLVLSLFPGIEKIYKPSIAPKGLDDFMYKLVRETVKFREENSSRRNDLIDLLMDLRNSGKITVDKTLNKEIEITETDVVAQVFVFLAAGFETSSSVSTYCLFELAHNTEIQEKLRNEIHRYKKKEGGLTYQAIMEMPYLDQVVSETMRKYPTIPILSRKCTSTYRMKDNPDRIVEKDIRILIPVYALHHDPQYYPNPEKFDPERFSPENKESIVPFTYLPFGEGPRLCIGMRFGLLQTKMGVATIVDRFTLKKTSRTPEKLNFVGSGLITITKQPVYLRIEKHS